MDYFQASIGGEFATLARGLVDTFAVGEPLAHKGSQGYGAGISIPTTDRGTLHLNHRGTHEEHSVRVSGWPTEPVSDWIRERYQGQASRVDSAVDFAGEISPVAEWLTAYARAAGMRWSAYHAGRAAEGVQVGAGTSEGRTRVYDADRAHPGEFTGPTGRLEAQWRPGTKIRKQLAYRMSAAEVLGAVKPARLALEEMGTAVPAAPARTRRLADDDRFLVYVADQIGPHLLSIMEDRRWDGPGLLRAVLAKVADVSVTGDVRPLRTGQQTLV